MDISNELGLSEFLNQIFAFYVIIDVTTPFYYRTMLLIYEINKFYNGKEQERY